MVEFIYIRKIKFILLATPNSWPAQVLIVMYYIGVYVINGAIRTIQHQNLCSGTLITPSVVMTAAHCISTTINYESQGIQLNLTVSPNWFFPRFNYKHKVKRYTNKLFWIFNLKAMDQCIQYTRGLII